MKYKLLLVTIVLFIGTMTSYGQTTVTIGGGATIVCPAVPTATWTTPPTGVSFSNWSRGSGVTCASAGTGLSGSGFNTASAGASYLANKYYSFTITAAATHTFTLNSFVWSTAISGTGPVGNFTVQYSNNGGALTTFGTVAQTSTTSNTFSGSVIVAAGTSIVIYAIPSGTAAAGTTVRFVNGSTINVTSSLAGITTATNGDWYTGATWTGGVVPTSADNAIINHAVTNVTGGATITRDLGKITTINAGASLSTGAFAFTNTGTMTVAATATLAVGGTYTNNGITTINGTFQINANGYANGSAPFVYAASGSTLVMNHSNSITYGIATGQQFWPTTLPPFNVTIAANSPTRIDNSVGAVAGTLTVNALLDCNVANAVTVTTTGTALVANQLKITVASGFTVNGVLQMNAGGFVNTNAPIYGSTSTLVYNTTYGVSTEWTGNTTAAGTGVPQNVTIQNTATVTMPNTNRGMAGNLTITSGNFTLNGTSGDVYLAGNWTRSAAAGFTPNTRAVFFNGATTQTITVSASGTETFNYLVVSGSGTLKLATGTNVVVNAASGLTLSSTNATSTIDLNGQTVTLSGGGNLSLSNGARKITSTIASGRLVVSGSILTVSNGGTLTSETATIVDLQNGFDCGVGSLVTVNGTLLISANGYSAGNSPRYGAVSLLHYNSGGAYNRQLEWTSTTAAIGGIGAPNNVQISNTTAFNYYNGANLGPKSIVGNLVVDSGSSFDMGAASTGGAVTIPGDVTVAGTLKLGFAVGDDFKTSGNVAFTGAGTFNGNNRALFFTKAGIQTVTSVAALTIPYVVTTGVGTTIRLLSSVVISGPATGNAISFGGANTDTIEITAGTTLTVGTTGVASVIGGTGNFKGSTTSNLTFIGVGSIGLAPLTFTSDLNLGTLVMNRTGGGITCVMGSPLTIHANSATALTLTNGIIDLNNTIMTIAATVPALTGGSAASYVIADVVAGGIFKVGVATNTTTYKFPIGDRSESNNGSEYSPCTYTFSAATLASAFLGVSVDDVKQPNMLDASTDFITRYWSVTNTGISGDLTHTFTGAFVTGDVVGTVGNCITNQWNGSAWKAGLAAGLGSVAGTVMTYNALTTLPTPNHMTAGNRDAEINIVQGATTYLANGTPIYDFGTKDTGTTTTVVFTVQNTGQQQLTFPVATVMTGNPPYTESVPLTTTAIAGGTSRNFSISFAPTAVGTFTGSISIANSDSSGSESPYVVNFTGVGVLPAPEIRLERATTAEIPSGSAASFTYDTLLAGQVIGVTSPLKTYTIRNTGTANLTLSNPVLSAGNTGDFTVSTATSLTIAPAGTATFTVSFTPTYLGTRTATISIANNDLTGGENPYLFNVSGDGSCAVTTNTATPASGPVGTEVTITATTGNLNNATVTFNGVSQPTVTYVNSSPTTIIKVIVPSGATSGNLITTNANGCSTSSTFTVLNNVANTCQGGNVATELFMSEVTDSNSGALSYVEIYNGTGVTKNLASYSLKTANNGGAYGFTLALSNVNLLAGNTYVVALGNDSSCSGIPGGNGSYAAQSSLSGSVNFNSGGHDHIGLFNGASLIDSWGVFGSNNWASTSFGPEGVSFRRKNTATLPNITFSNSDWNIIDFLENTSAYCANNDYTDIGIYNFLSGTPPTVTIHPIYTPTCKAASLTVAGTEGYNVAGLDTQELGYQWFVSIPPATGWTALTNGAIYTGVTTATLNISNVSGLTNNQYYCQIQENTSTCYAASNAVKIIDGVTVTWNGTWIGGSPTFNKAVIIDADYDMNLPLPSFEACSVTVNTGRIVTITDGKYVSILNDLTVVGTGNVIVKDNGSLVQIYDSGVNTGEIDVKRIATIKKKDYVYWSSPVSGFPVTSISPGTPSTLIWKWEPLVVSNGFEGNWVNPATPTMAEGVGYIVRGPGAFNNTTATDLTAPFRGVPLNGIKQPSIVRGTNMGVGIDYGGSTRTERDDNYNLVGNPYASAISANDFLVTNAKTGTNTSGGIEGFIYLWSHGSLPAILITDPFYNNYVYNYNPNDYITYNLMGASCGACFNGYVASGQSFFVVKDAVTTANTVTFNNSMRRNSTLGTYYDNSNFFRTAITTSTLDNQAAPKSRIWLDLIGPTPANESTRMLVGYSSEATFAKDVLYDANTKVGTNQNFYSVLDNQCLGIQGRPLPFNDTDMVTLGVKLPTTATYTIAINTTDGLFASAQQNIYLEDTALNIIHDLRQAPYVFTAAAGRFDTRFVLRYTNSNPLGTDDFTTLNNSVVVATPNPNQMNITSAIENMKSVAVYDILGRVVYTNTSVNASQLLISDVVLNQQALIVKITLENGQIVTRKVVL